MSELILADLGLFILFSMMGIGFFVVMLSGTEVRKSKKYRKFLTDMYVSAKIRFLADKDGLKLTEEEKYFKDWSKKDKIRNREYNLDDAVEEDLIEKIEEPVVKK
jgi:hypothetical protein